VDGDRGGEDQGRASAAELAQEPPDRGGVERLEAFGAGHRAPKLADTIIDIRAARGGVRYRVGDRTMELVYRRSRGLGRRSRINFR
jgi:hypothetical protein